MPAFGAFQRKLFANLLCSFNFGGRLASLANDAGSWPLKRHITTQMVTYRPAGYLGEKFHEVA